MFLISHKYSHKEFSTLLLSTSDSDIQIEKLTIIFCFAIGKLIAYKLKRIAVLRTIKYDFETEFEYNLSCAGNI